LLVIAAALLPDPVHADRRRDDAKAQVDFGMRVARAGLWHEAQFRFERAVQLDPTYAAAWNNLAIVYEQSGEHDKAKKAYERALQLAPKSAFIRENYDLFREVHDRMTRPPCSRPPC
jgi:Tfp pilus assembly protein PilF